MSADERTNVTGQQPRRMWGVGDYGPTSRQLEPVSVALAATLELGPGLHVLDLGAGYGNCAVAAAERGAGVVAADLSPEMIRHGRARTEAADLEVSWHEADAAELPFADDTFDVVASVFAMIFGSPHEQVAREAARVTRPGGRVGFTAWTPDGFTAQLQQVRQRQQSVPPPDGPGPMDWGDESYVRSLFAPLGCRILCTRRSVTFRYPSWSAWQAATESHGMSVTARETLPADEYAAIRRDMRALTESYNYADDGSVVYDADYLETVVTVP